MKIIYIQNGYIEDLLNQRKENKRKLKIFYNHNKEYINNFHKQYLLNFHSLPIFEFKHGIKIHKSPTRDKRQSSEYNLIMVNNRIAYARKANHWGYFETKNTLTGELEGHRWNLLNGDNDKRTSQAGFIYLE